MWRRRVGGSRSPLPLDAQRRHEAAYRDLRGFKSVPLSLAEQAVLLIRLLAESLVADARAPAGRTGSEAQ
jgi:hypothetical protein